MTAAETVHIGDVGTIFEVTVVESGAALDISSATTKEIIFTKPKGTKVTKVAAFTTDGTDGKVQYQSQAADSVAPVAGEGGVWKLQGKIVIPQGTFLTDLGSYIVSDP